MIGERKIKEKSGTVGKKEKKKEEEGRKKERGDTGDPVSTAWWVFLSTKASTPSCAGVADRCVAIHMC